jgi:hypothetical protein
MSTESGHSYPLTTYPLTRYTMAIVKQNKGAKPKRMSEPHDSVVKAPKGDAAVEFRGTFAHAAKHTGVTRPSKGNAGSHDSKIREHADHED